MGRAAKGMAAGLDKLEQMFYNSRVEWALPGIRRDLPMWKEVPAAAARDSLSQIRA